jgi:titin
MRPASGPWAIGWACTWGGVTVGGTAPGAANLISGNQTGIQVVNDGGQIQGNLIGTDVTGASALGNVIGIYVAASGTIIGGTGSGAGNTIAYNANVGVEIDGNGNAILGNSIFANGQAGIGNDG